MQNALKLILASTSPRRRELIQLLGHTVDLVAVRVDESPRIGETARDLVERLSREKASQAAAHHPDAIVIAADTDVELDGQILGKPKDLPDAIRMLRALRGRDHLVYTGLCIVKDGPKDPRTLARSAVQPTVQVVETTVRMRAYTDAQIAEYVETGNPLDKAAAYAIQHNDFRPVASIGGCQANVMGLPLCHLYLALGRAGIELREPDIACQEHLKIVCPVAKGILSGRG